MASYHALRPVGKNLAEQFPRATVPTLRGTGDVSWFGWHCDKYGQLIRARGGQIRFISLSTGVNPFFLEPGVFLR